MAASPSPLTEDSSSSLTAMVSMPFYARAFLSALTFDARVPLYYPQFRGEKYLNRVHQTSEVLIRSEVVGVAKVANN